MNDNTRRQWQRYCEEHPWLSAHQCLVLYWLVHDHSAAEGFTRPGHARLERMTHADHKTITRALSAMVERGDLVLMRKGRGREADEYAIPWLSNPVHKSPPAREISRTRSRTNSRTSSPLRGDRRSGPREDGAPAAAQPGDATDWCALCEQYVPDGGACRCEDCDGLYFGCRVQPDWQLPPSLRVVRS